MSVKAFESRARWLRDYLKTNMEACGISKIESPWFCLSIQNNQAVEIFDEAAIPRKFKKKVVTLAVDKAAIKQTINAGRKVKGAVVTQGTRLVVR